MDRELEAFWVSAWPGVMCTRGRRVYDELLVRLGEDHRHYHTLTHVRECFHRLAEYSGECQSTHAVRLAIWFHDAIHDSRSSSNEQESASWAKSAIGAKHPELAGRVERLIMATTHRGDPGPSDEAVMCDVDLAILGASRERFDEYEDQVRQEYSWVPDADFRDGRLGVLQSFTSRPWIFATTCFRRRFESAARKNLRRSIDRLSD